MVLVAAAIGFLIGALLVLVIDGVPAEIDEDELTPRLPLRVAATCACGTPRRGLVALALPALRRPCPACGVRAPGRATVVPVVAALLCALMVARFGSTWPTIGYCALALVMVPVTFIDLDHHRIPDWIVFPSLVASVAFVVAVSLALGHRDAVVRAFIGAAAFAGILFVLWLVYPKGMGFGDVKFALVLGLYVGWVDPILVVWALLFGSIAGIVWSIPTVVRMGRKAPFAFGPALCIGTIAALVFANQVLPY